MTNKVIIHYQASFFFSSLTLENRFQKLDDFLIWFYRKKEVGSFSVKKIPFCKLDKWNFTDNDESLVHQSGKFFRIEGIKVQTNFGGVNEWEQPIINQPEIGILGILTKVFYGTRYFLMQAKMEPGNINILQLSPTVQATKSNFSRIHKGKIPVYLEYFVDSSKSKVLIDQLQTEQGGRFLRKRNRNIVIDVNDEIEVLDDFCWLTLGEIKKLLAIDNFVNMDARSVLSTIPLIDDEIISTVKENSGRKKLNLKINGINFSGLNLDLIKSTCNEDAGQRTNNQLIAWYTRQKVNYDLTVKTIPLSQLKSWKITEDRIFNNERYFSIIAVEIHAGTREVTAWTQPLFEDKNIGMLGFLVKKINGILHFLIQAKVEPGNIDIIELSPTVSCSNMAYLKINKKNRPLFFDYFTEKVNVRILFDSLQSEEGGRFSHLQNRNKIVELDENEDFELPDNYIWMTLKQMMDFMKFSMFNIEARSLVSCLNFFSE
jgi:dTDP-4-dehydro-6-deoxy-alpha-D-glucopyranose 2,3-dehydratase